MVYLHEGEISSAASLLWKLWVKDPGSRIGCQIDKVIIVI